MNVSVTFGVNLPQRGISP